MSFIVAVLLAAVFGQPAQAKDFARQLDNTCGTVSGSPSWDYCITKTPGSRNNDVVYQLHGSGGSARVWIDDQHAREMRDTWHGMRADAPTVVTVSFGRFWMLVSKNGAPKSGLGDYFFDTVIPHVENELLDGDVGKRKLFGISMGGFNAASLMLDHPEAFSSVVLACPAILRLSPYAHQKEIDAYIARSQGGNARSINNMVRMTAPYFPDQQSWDMTAPLGLAKRTMKRTHPALHVSCGDSDVFGIIEGSKDLADIAKAAGVKTVWLPLSGGHCVMDTASMAEFLIEN